MAQARHKRETSARRFAPLSGSRAAKVTAISAAVATLPAIALGVVAADHRGGTVSLEAHQQAPLRLDPERYDSAPVSRTFDRTAARNFQEGIAAQRATARAVDKASVKKWTTVALNIWSSSSKAARQIGLMASGKQVLVTGRAADGRVEIVVDGQSRWVTAGYLSENKPEPPTTSDPTPTTTTATPQVSAAAGLSMAPCPDGSVESGLTSGAIYVYRSVCHAFPQITTYLGWDAHGEHSSGKALDIMTSDVTLGNAIAAFLQQHASELHIYDILWRQHIWTPVRASEGWRLFADRGSATANHYDHVHVSVY